METCPCTEKYLTSQKRYGRRRKGKKAKKDSKHINFVKEGNPTTVKTTSEQETILESATSWEMQAYLG